MDNNMIGQSPYIGGFNEWHAVDKKQAETKAPVKPQEEIVTEWQMPADDLVAFQEPVKEKPPEKMIPSRPIWVEVAPHRFDNVSVDTSFRAPTPPRGPAEEPVNVRETTPENPAQMASGVPVTLKMDDPGQLADFINWGIQRNEFGIQTPEKLNTSGPIDIISMDTVKMADSSTAFFKIGMNTINSIARDGIFTVDGEQLAKPGA